jgi:prophage antirepressor-like protein
LEELDKYRIINATGNKSEWINMEKDNLIDVINKNISTHDYGKNIEIFKNIVPNFNIYETLEHNYIMFEKSNIHVIIDDDDRIWFSVKDTLLALGYKDYKDAIKRHVDKKYVKEKQYINYEHLSGQPRTLYITESGLYKMITRSRLPKAIRFTDWIFDDLLPKIRKFGKYQLKKNYDNEMSELSKKINFLEKQNKIFKSDLKKEKFPKGGVVYVIDYSDENEEIYRIGMTGNMKTRKRLYNTHTLHNHNNIMIKETPCPIKLESCLRSLLYDYRYKNNKDFYLCPLIKIKNALKYCQQNIKKCSVNQSGGGSKTNKITHFKSMIDHMISKNKIQKKRIKNKIIKLGKILDND